MVYPHQVSFNKEEESKSNFVHVYNLLWILFSYGQISQTQSNIYQ